MRGAVFFHMWTVLILGTLTGVVRAQVSTTKVMRGNNRRDGEITFFFLTFFSFNIDVAVITCFVVHSVYVDLCAND